MRWTRSLLVLALLAPSVALGQSTGTIAGVVTAEYGAPVERASVTISGTLLGRVTEINGRFTIENVPAGTHTVVVKRLGFAQQSRPVTVSPGQTATVNLALVPQAAILNEV